MNDDQVVLNIGQESGSTIQGIVNYKSSREHELGLGGVTEESYLEANKQREFKQRFIGREFYLDENATEDPCIRKDISQSVFQSNMLLLNDNETVEKTRLPTGFLLSPFYHPIHSPMAIRYEPPMCSQCGAYVNVYCAIKKVDIHQDQFQWVCSVCHQGNLIDDGSKGVRSIEDLRRGLGWWTSEHYKQAFSGESYDFRVKPHLINEDGVDGITRGVAENLSIEEEEEERIDPEEKESEYPTYCFVVDENLSLSELKAVHRSIRSLLSEKDIGYPHGKIYLALLTFSKLTSVYFMKNSSASILTSNKGFTEDQTGENLTYNTCNIITPNTLIGGRSAFSRRSKLYLEAVNFDGPRNIDDSKLLSQLTSYMEICENQDAGDEYEKQPTNLALALKVAWSLCSYRKGSRIFTFLGGAPTLGNGSVPSEFTTSGISAEEQNQIENSFEFYSKLEEKGSRSPVDFILIGFNEFFAKVFSSLTVNTGGHMYTIHDANMEVEEKAQTIYLNMFNSIRKSRGHEAFMAIVHPEYIGLSHLIGPAIENPYQGHVELPFMIKSRQQDASFVILYELNSPIPSSPKMITFQFIIKMFDVRGKQTTRVITKRVYITHSYERFLDSFDMDVVAVIMAKKVIRDSLKNTVLPNPLHDRHLLDAGMKDIVMGSSKIEKGWFWSRPTITVPKPIQDLLYIIHRVRSGLLFADLIQNTDDLVVLQSIFINSSYIDSRRLLLPKLLRVMPSIENPDTVVFKNIPFDSLSVNPATVLILDCLSSIYFFIGTQVKTLPHSQKLITQAQQYIEILKKDRIPSPTILRSNERDHNVRWMLALLQSTILLPAQERIQILSDIFPEIDPKSINNVLDQYSNIHPIDSNNLTLFQYNRLILYDEK